MDKAAEMYVEEVTPANQLKGYTKSFQKKTKDKKGDDQNIKDLLTFKKENRLILGSKVTEKAFKSGKANKVYFASNCDELTEKKIRHYGKLSGVEIVALDIDNKELGQKLGKPFLISTICVRVQ